LLRDWRTLARTSPIAWATKATRGTFRAPRHIQFFANLQTDILAGREQFILLSVPPRHGKSFFWSEMLPPFWLGNRPEDSVALASYESGLAAGFSEKARNAMTAAGPDVFGLSVHPKRNATDNWKIVRAGKRRMLGGMQAVGVGGALTGKTAHLLLIDDPIKGSEQANSETMRAKLWDWWFSEAMTRLTPDIATGRQPACVIIHTRWHEDDLIGRLLAEMKNGGPRRWRYINLPAIAEEGVEDPLGRLPGESLWPEVYPPEWFAPFKVDPYWWSALYQGRPQPATGGIFKRSYFRYFSEEPHYFTLHVPGEVAPKRVPKDGGYYFSTTDPATGRTGGGTDYTVTCIWFVTTQNDLLLIDIVRDRIEGPEQLDLVDNFRRRYRLALCGFESVAYQMTSVQHLARRGVPVVELHADKDKRARALTAAARMQQGTIYMRLGGYKTNPPCDLDVIEAELLQFDNAAHDDIVDNFAYAAIHVADGRPGAA
jgi:predicted phage terminase large subunit-like protein